MRLLRSLHLSRRRSLSQLLSRLTTAPVGRRRRRVLLRYIAAIRGIDLGLIATATALRVRSSCDVDEASILGRWGPRPLLRDVDAD